MQENENELSKYKIAGSFMSKKDADAIGFNYDIYEYEAKMIGEPGRLVIEGLFRVTGDMAVIANKTNTAYLIVKLKDKNNPDISFVRVSNEPESDPSLFSKAIVVASKAKIMGQTFNTIELIEALKNPTFKDDAPVMINLPDGDGGEITLIFKCSSCNKLHISAVQFEIGDDDENEHKIQDEFLRSLISNDESDSDNLSDSIKGKIYLDRTNGQHENPLTRREFLDILESIPEILPIGLDSFDENGSLYTLTNVYKCSECEAIHLDCTYDEHSHSLN
jgi:hypothetical protein